MPHSISAIENLPPIDRLTVRLAEWARFMGSNSVDPLTTPGQDWVPPARVRHSDEGATPDGEAEREPPNGPFRDAYVQFVIDRTTKQVSVRIIDRRSGQVIRTIPPEEILKLLYEGTAQVGSLIETRL